MKQVRPLLGVVQLVKIYNKDADGGVGEIADVDNTKGKLKAYIRERKEDLDQVSLDLKTSEEYAQNKAERELLEWGQVYIQGQRGVAKEVAVPVEAVDLSAYKIGVQSLEAANLVLSNWAAAHPKSKGALKPRVVDAMAKLGKVMIAPQTLDKDLHDEIAEVVVLVNQAEGVKGASNVTPEMKKAAKKQKAKEKAKAEITIEEEFEGYADLVIGAIAVIKQPGDRGVDVNGPPGSSENATMMFQALQKYHNKPTGWWLGVRYYIVRGPGTKIDVTGHEWVHGVDKSKANGTNVFNYHLNW